MADGNFRRWVEKHFEVERWRGDEADVHCRLHDDAHASCSINVAKAVFKCQACGRGGKVSYLARELGIDVPYFPGNGRGKLEVARFDYRDAGGKVIYQVVRFAPKGFRQFNPSTNEWSIKGVQRVPYRLPELLAGIKAGKVIWIAEGEKDVDALVRLGFVATCNQGGFGSSRLWRSFTKIYFTSGTRVVLCPDADEPGQQLASEIAGSLTAVGCKVKKVDLGYPIRKNHGKDISNWIAEGHSQKELIEIAKKSAPFASEFPGPRRGNKKPKQADIAVRLSEGCELFHDGEETFVRLQIGDHREVWPLRAREFRTWLRRQFYLQTKTAIGSSALDDALGVLEGKALFEGPAIKTAVRIAGDDRRIYLDLGNEAWEVVEITAAGWRVLKEAPMCFRRPAGLKVLPTPQRGGRLDVSLEPFLNMSAYDCKLFIACLINALRPKGPYPVLCLHGEQGSAKSTAARIFRSCVDPNTAMLRSPPREERDMVVAAHNGWIIAYDNLSHLPPWVSDALCRIATGAGFSARALYTDDEECLFQAQRPVVLNGIEDLASRGDLLDRSVVVYLPAIEEENRLTERNFNKQFTEVLPEVIGALLDAVSAAIRNLPHVELTSVPRMADFAEWVVAAEPVLGWKPGTFLDIYRRNRADANTIALDASPMVPVLVKLLDRAPWEGTATDLQEALSELAGERKRKSRAWPKSGRTLSATLKRLAPNLREVGILVEWNRSGRQRTIRLKLKSYVTSSPDSPSASDAMTQESTLNLNGYDDALEVGRK